MASSSAAPPRVRDEAEYARWKEGGRRDDVGLERRLARDIAGIVVSMDVSRKVQICEAHHRARRLRRLATAALVVAALAAAVALALYLVYRPVRPQASVSRAAVYRLASANGSLATSFPSAAPAPTHALAASVQFTLLLHNPSDRASLLYDGLVAYAAYRGEPVTPPAPLPPVVQDRGADVVMSPLLGGAAVPVSPDTARALAADCAARRVQLRLVVMGRVKYRSGPFRSGWRDLYVRCNVIVGLSTEAAVAGGGDVPLLEYPRCAVDA
uniref:Late embryogenesis abundant protein LEA-2 subgroup domain-containing protein n=1 Tax=Oryza punctata TaxID=4537 RepID=A0A0E0M3T0_ORYPU